MVATMDVFSVLKADHDKAKAEFKALLEAESSIDRKAVKTLCESLKVHMLAEEKVVYPVFQQVKEIKELSQEGQLEHDEAKKFLKALIDDPDMDEMAYKVKLEMLQLAVEHHIEEEEKEIFPLARKALSKKQIEEMTEHVKAELEKKTKVSSSQK